MSEDYDRLRADVAELRYKHFADNTKDWMGLLLVSLLEKHPAREASTAAERDLCMESRECRCSACEEERRIANEHLTEPSDPVQLNTPEDCDAFGTWDTTEPSPPTPARATAVSELVVAARRYVEDMGPCDCIDEDDDESYCSDPRCQYCALAKAVNPRELDL